MATLAHHLHRIRQQPDHIKRHIAFWTSLCITLVIVIFWIASISLSQNSSAKAVAASTESPWSAMTASVGDAWTSFTASLGSATTVYKAPPLEVTAGN